MSQLWDPISHSSTSGHIQSSVNRQPLLFLSEVRVKEEAGSTNNVSVGLLR